MFLIWRKLPAMTHLKMVPFERMESLKNAFNENKDPRMAAVMMLFYKEWDDTFGFNCTESYEGVHSGQIAFPGGKWETEDEIFCDSLRETHEERWEYIPIRWKLLSFYAYLYPSK
jgi:8-oxo-dGTP pyrophosphatase MutT (NUDIX family)